jgi:hypothetical protein
VREARTLVRLTKALLLPMQPDTPRAVPNPHRRAAASAGREAPAPDEVRRLGWTTGRSRTATRPRPLGSRECESPASGAPAVVGAAQMHGYEQSAHRCCFLAQTSDITSG